MSAHSTAHATRLPANEPVLFERVSDKAADARPGGASFGTGGAPGGRWEPAGPGRSPAVVVAAAPLRPTPQPPPALPRGQKADHGGAPALTPRLAEIIAAMVDAVLDAEDSRRAARGTVAIRRSRAPRDHRPAAAERDAREVQA
jgi:hypothetical protein